MKNIVIAFILCSFSMMFSQQNAYYQQEVAYEMDIDVDVKNFTYQGKQTVTYTNNSPDELKKVYFHLYWNAFQPGSMMDQRTQALGKDADGRLVETIDGQKVSKLTHLTEKEIGYQRIHFVQQEGQEVTTVVDGTILEVTLHTPIPAGGSSTFYMEWDSQIPKQIRRSGRQNKEGIELSMTQWYPKMVEYDYEGWHAFEYIGREFHGVFGTFDINIHIDKDYIIGAGGVLQNPEEVKGYVENPKIKAKKRKATWHWKAENIHDFAWAADPDYTVETFKANHIDIYYVYQKGEKTHFWEEAKPKVVQFFSLMNDNFGEYPYPSYSFIQGGDGGMEYGMCTLIVGNATSLKGLCGLMFHEAAHSWYQQVIATNESMRPWMDEGFTSYAEEFCMSQIFPEEYAELPNFMAKSIQSFTQYQQSGKEEPLSTLADHYHSGKAYGTSSYTKGSVFLSTLEYIIGEDNLRKTLLEYYNQWKFKHPTEKDFLHIAQQVSGMDLKWYFNYMINTTYQVDYAIDSVENSGDTLSTVVLENKGQFPMPIDLYVVDIHNQIHLFNIPLRMMRGKKNINYPNIQFEYLEDWTWTSPQYQANIPIKKEDIKIIILDASYAIPDVDYSNNVWQNHEIK